jgi:hypothetical protein
MQVTQLHTISQLNEDFVLSSMLSLAGRNSASPSAKIFSILGLLIKEPVIRVSLKRSLIKGLEGGTPSCSASILFSSLLGLGPSSPYGG